MKGPPPAYDSFAAPPNAYPPQNQQNQYQTSQTYQPQTQSQQPYEQIPPYQSHPGPANLPLTDTKPPIPHPSQVPQQQPRFPRQFGFYHHGGTFSQDIAIALHADNPPLFTVEIHSGLSSKPSITLHSTSPSPSPSPSTARLATVDLHSFSKNSDIVLYAQDGPQEAKLVHEGALSSVRFFDFVVSGRMERFEWRRSKGDEVASLGGRRHGKKLVWVRTGEVVAAWGLPNSGLKKKGKMAFVGRQELGDGFELMAVVTILAIMEIETRHNNAASSGSFAGASAG